MSSDEDVIVSENAPDAVGAYPHARRVGDFVFLSGVGPRQPITNDIPVSYTHLTQPTNRDG